MSKIDKTFFRWTPGVIDCPINLNDSKESLLAKGLIKEVRKDGETEYKGIEGTPWKINFQNDKVDQIWFDRNSTFKIDGVEISRSKYVEILDIIESNFQSLHLEIRSTDELNSYGGSDVLYIICRDFYVTLIAIIRRTY